MLQVRIGIQGGSTSSDTQRAVGDRAKWRVMEAKWPYGAKGPRSMLVVAHQAPRPNNEVSDAPDPEPTRLRSTHLEG